MTVRAPSLAALLLILVFAGCQRQPPAQQPKGEQAGQPAADAKNGRPHAQYCVLAFGPEAKTRIRLVLEGGSLHAEDEVQGGFERRRPPIAAKPHGEKETVFEVGAITESENTKHTDIVVTRGHLWDNDALALIGGGTLLRYGVGDEYWDKAPEDMKKRLDRAKFAKTLAERLDPNGKLLLTLRIADKGAPSFNVIIPERPGIDHDAEVARITHAIEVQGVVQITAVDGPLPVGILDQHRVAAAPEADRNKSLDEVDRTIMTVSVKLHNGLRQSARLRFADREDRAPVVRFNGPLKLDVVAIHPLPFGRVVRPGDELRLFTRVGTPGSSKDAFAQVDVRDIPGGAHPKADFEFPRRARKDSIRTSTLLSLRVGEDLEGFMMIPLESGPGEARVTLSFDAWKGANVGRETQRFPVGTPQ